MTARGDAGERGDSGDDFPRAVLLVDSPAIAALFAGSREAAEAGLAVVCVDGSPASQVASLQRGFRKGRRAPLLYLHDAATVIYPFSVEPFATLVAHVEQAAEAPLVYADLGLPPLGATARRFGDPSLARLAPDALVTTLDEIPGPTLVRYCTEALLRLRDRADRAGRQKAR